MQPGALQPEENSGSQKNTFPHLMNITAETRRRREYLCASASLRLFLKNSILYSTSLLPFSPTSLLVFVFSSGLKIQTLQNSTTADLNFNHSKSQRPRTSGLYTEHSYRTSSPSSQIHSLQSYYPTADRPYTSHHHFLQYVL